MAKKSLILDNGDGRVTFSNTASLSVDDGAGNNMSASYVTASSLSISGLGVGQVKLLSASSGTPGLFPDGTVNGGAIAFNGTSWVPSSILVQDYSGSAYGDLSGSYESGVQVKNISNVNAGTLPVAFGGTGKSIPAGQGYILKVSSSVGQTPVISALSASSGSILTTYGGAWTSILPGYPDVRFYTSGSTGNTFTWNRPTGARFARVILQGAGGGGGGSGTTNGGGGGSGGYTDITLDVSNIPQATIVVGIGGNGGTSSPTTVGSDGGNTTFYNNSYYANGGQGGRVNAGGAAAGGIGLTKNGGFGGNSTTGGAGETVYGMPSGGGTGNDNAQNFQPGTVVPMFANGIKNFGYNISSDGVDLSIIVLATGAYCTPGSTVHSRPGFGAGGCGTRFGARGGPGGHGYALIISW